MLETNGDREWDTTERGVETLAGVPSHRFGKGHPDSWHPERNPEEQWVGRPHRPRRAVPAARKPPAGRAEAWEVGALSAPTYVSQEISAMCSPSSPFLPGPQGN